MDNWKIGLAVCALAAAAGCVTPGSTTPRDATPAGASGSGAAVEDLDVADRLAKCSAAYVVQYRILEAAGKPQPKLAKASEWFYEAASERSDVEQTKARFTVHYKAYGALNESVKKAAPEARVDAAKRFTGTLNADFDACDALRAQLSSRGR